MGVDVFDNKYYRLNKNILYTLGLWPLQDSKSAVIYFSIMSCFLFSQIYIQVYAFILAFPVLEEVVEDTMPLCIAFGCFIKVGNTFVHKKKFKRVYKFICDSWANYVHNDYELLLEYSEKNRKNTKLYCSILYSGGVIFISVPIVQGLYEILSSTSDFSYPLQFKVRKVIDVERWYIYIYVHSIFSTIYFISISVGLDTMMFTLMSHICAQFAILGSKFQCLQSPEIIDYTRNDESKNEVIRVFKIYIERHKLILAYARLLDSCYKWGLFSVLIDLTLCLCVIAVQLMVASRNGNYTIFITSFANIVPNITHLWFNSYPCQEIADHSVDISNAIYMSKWYTYMNKRSSMIIPFTIMRSQIPSNITLGGLAPMSINVFSNVVRTCSSYTTLLLSFV